MSTLETLYKEAVNTPTDINEHLPILKAYASTCSHVTELGCRWGNSSLAFLAAKPKTLVSYDLEIYPKMEFIFKTAQLEMPEVDFKLKNGNTLFEDIEETDLLFLDSFHVYEQVLCELVYHASKARKFIVFHDTETFKDEGQAGGYRGIGKIIEGFLLFNPQWVVIEDRKNNNGLMVLAKNLRPTRFFKNFPFTL